VSEAKKVYLFGYSGHAYVIIESFMAAGYSIAGYFDFQEANSNPYHIPYCGYEENVDVKSIVKNNFVFPSVGENLIRSKLVAFFEKHQLNQCTLIDPGARISKSCSIGLSTYVGVNAIINAQSRVGQGAIINTGRNNTSVCSNVILGSGSVVVKSIIEEGIWVGNPSKKIK